MLPRTASGTEQAKSAPRRSHVGCVNQAYAAVSAINAKIDSVIRATPGHLLFTEEQRKVYTTIGGCHHLDGVYTIYGEVTEGLELIDQIATQPKDQYDRPKKDIRIKKISIL